MRTLAKSHCCLTCLAPSFGRYRSQTHRSNGRDGLETVIKNVSGMEFKAGTFRVKSREANCASSPADISPPWSRDGHRWRQRLAKPKVWMDLAWAPVSSLTEISGQLVVKGWRCITDDWIRGVTE